jgi:hypothetical protein
MGFPSAFAMLTALVVLATTAPASAQGFKFEQPNTGPTAEEIDKQNRVAWELSTPCRADLKGKKIMLIIGEERSNGYIAAQQQNYGPHYQAINGRLRAMGLQTFTPEEIRRQIAQAEIDAYFKNNPDAALSAAKRLGASFILRGVISAQAVPSIIAGVNTVTVSFAFTLTGGNGRIVSDTTASSSSYSGTDVSRMALTLVNEQIDEVVAKLYGDYCRNAAPASARQGGKEVDCGHSQSQPDTRETWHEQAQLQATLSASPSARPCSRAPRRPPRNRRSAVRRRRQARRRRRRPMPRPTRRSTNLWCTPTPPRKARR